MKVFLFSFAAGLAGGALVFACGGDDTTPEMSTGDATVLDGALNGDTGTEGDDDSSSGADGGTNTDAANGGDGSNPANGSNPGQVTCGAVACDAGAICCLRIYLDGGTSQSCQADCNGPGAIDFRCDEKADCPTAGNKCCLSIGGSSCANDCPGPTNAEILLCKTNAECGDGGVCNEKTCANRKFNVCGSPNACN